MHPSFPRNAFTKSLKTGLVLALGITIAGCQSSSNPLDYLPEASGGYMGINMEAMENSAGLKRLSDEMDKMAAGTSELGSDKAQKVYMAFDSPANANTVPPMYGVATGTPGFADEVVDYYQKAGATAGKTSGMTTYTSGTISIAPVGDTGILVFQDTTTLDRMIAVSKKKQPGAAASDEFRYVSSQTGDHALVIAGDIKPALDMGGPMLTNFEMSNPQAAEAIRQITMASLVFDWDTNPVATIKLHLNDKSQADVLASTINNYLMMAKQLPMVSANPQIASVVTPLTAQSAEDGVTLVVNVPAEVAEQLFTMIENQRQMQSMGATSPAFSAPPF